MIDVPSPEVTLVLKLQPSEDLSFILLLGTKDYPNDTNYVAKTQFPLENANEGQNSNCFCDKHAYQDCYETSLICKNPTRFLKHRYFFRR